MVLPLEPQGTDRVKVEDTLQVTRSHQGWCPTVLVSFCFFCQLDKSGVIWESRSSTEKMFPSYWQGCGAFFYISDGCGGGGSPDHHG